MAWVFPADTVLDEPGFVGRSSPISIVSDAVNSLMAAPIPHHYGAIDLANSIDPESRRLANGQPWSFHINKFYRDPLSDQIPSERGHEIWERGAPFADRDFQWHQETVRNVVKRTLHAISYVAEKITRLLADHPHTHIVLRGRDDRGKDLVIARDYISHGMRRRASELLTLELGPQTEQEIRHKLERQVEQDRFFVLSAGTAIPRKNRIPHSP